MFQYPHFDPIAFSIGPVLGLGPLAVRWYGITYLCAFACSWLGMRLRTRQPWSKIKAEQVDDIVFYAALGVIIGGRLGYMILPYGFAELRADPLSIFTVWKGGMSFHGGLAGVLIAMWLYGRRIGQPFFVVTDAIAPWSALGLGFGRIGNFINGELWGKVTSPDAPWAVMVNGEPRHASQLYEMFLEGFVLWAILFFYSRKQRPTMAVSGLFLLFYGLFRILVEFVRVPDKQLGYIAFDWLTMGQILSIPMVIVGVILFVLANRSKGDAAADIGGRPSAKADAGAASPRAVPKG